MQLRNIIWRKHYTPVIRAVHSEIPLRFNLFVFFYARGRNSNAEVKDIEHWGLKPDNDDDDCTVYSTGIVFHSNFGAVYKR